MCYKIVKSFINSLNFLITANSNDINICQLSGGYSNITTRCHAEQGHRRFEAKH